MEEAHAVELIYAKHTAIYGNMTVKHLLISEKQAHISGWFLRLVVGTEYDQRGDTRYLRL